jgi:hypothetical protein
MAILTMDSLKWEKLMVKVFILGKMERFMMESGIKASSMVMEFGKDSMGILILENGDILKQKVMGCTLGKMEIDMKVNGNYV